MSDFWKELLEEKLCECPDIDFAIVDEFAEIPNEVWENLTNEQSI